MDAALLADWLSPALAAANYRGSWLKQFLKSHLHELKDLENSSAGQAIAQAWNQKFQRLMVDRGLKESSQQRNPYSQVANAIRVLDPQHFALGIVCLPSEFHTEFNAARADDLEHRLPKFITSEAATRLVERAHQLLLSENWAEVAAALAVLLGRRVGEILLGGYSLESPWTIRVEGIFKRQAGEPSLMVLIPTLAPAPQVIEAISRLQSHCNLSDLQLEDKDLQQQKRLVNSRFSQEVSLACKRLFAGMVPARETDDAEGSKLYTHLFRAVYATIAAHWFCPPQIQHEHYFKAHIQGHYKWVPSLGWQVSLNSRANYDDYLIGDGNGNRDGRLGIKLAELDVAALQVGAVQSQEQKAEMLSHEQLDEQAMTSVPTSSTAISAPLPADSLVEETGLESAQPNPQDSTVSGQSLPDEIADDSISAGVPQAVSESAPATGGRHKPKRRVKQLSVDCEQLRRVAHRFGVDILGGRGQGYEQAIAQLLTRLEDADPSPPAPVPDITAAMAAQARTLDWLTREVDTLRQQVASLQAELDQAVSQTAQPHPLQQEFETLQSENARLRQVEQKFEHLKKTFLNGTGEQTVPEQPQANTPPPSMPSAEPISQPVAPRKQRSAKPAVPQPATATLTIADDKQESIRQMIRSIVHAIMHFNHQQSYKSDKIRIGFDPVKALATHYGVNNQQRIKEVFEELADELQHHHQAHELGPRHNTGKDYSRLPQLIPVA